MNIANIKMTPLVLLPAAMLTLSSCSSTSSGPDATQQATVIESRNGAMIVDTVTLTATVKAIDADTRELRLTSPDGYQTAVVAAKTVLNFDQIKAGDQIKVKATEAFAVDLRPRGTPANLGEGTAVAVTPRGGLPGGAIASTMEVNAKITAVDVKSRAVTLQFRDGSSKQLKVGATVNLVKVKPGDTVTVRVAEALAITVTKS